MESLGALLAELSSLRKTLSNASGKMSAAQAERFEAIKAKYMQGMKALGNTALSFKVEVMIYCPYPVHCEPGISFIFECQRVILLSKSVFLSFLSKKA